MRAIIRHYYTYTLAQNKVSYLQMINCFGYYRAAAPSVYDYSYSLSIYFTIYTVQVKYINQFVYYTFSESSGQIPFLPASYNKSVMHL